jgi:radical SAM protein with 4Fe4S-binding SPASM domain
MDEQYEIELPKIIELEPAEVCNLRCRMCHVSYIPEESRPSLSIELIERLSCLKGAYFFIGSGFEPMMNREFNKIIRTLTKYQASIELVTNATLLDEESRLVLQDSNLRTINFSFDGIRKETYEHIRRRSNFDLVIDNIIKMRQLFEGRSTYFAVNSTMMRRNMGEVSEILRFWEQNNFDLIRMIFMVVRAPDLELIQESLFPVRHEFYKLLDAAALEVIENSYRIGLRSPYFAHSPLRQKYPQAFHGDTVLSDHPGARIVPMPRQEHQLGAGYGMKFPCRSPFTFARILANGDVQVCYQFTIGNLKDQPFEDIWFGAKARDARSKVRSTETLCRNCDYFRFCLNSAHIDVNDKIQYFSNSLIPYADAAIESMSSADDANLVNIPMAPPRLVESVGVFNIVEYRKNYFIIHKSIGYIDLQTVEPMTIDGILQADTLRQARVVAVSQNEAVV